MAAPKKTSSGSISKLLKGASEVDSKSKSKSGVPTITGYEVLADEVAEAKIQFEDAEANFKLKEVAILEVASKIYTERAHGDFSKSFNFAGGKDPGVQVGFTDRFSDLPADAEEGLRTVLGAKFDDVFEESRKLELSKTDDDTIQLLIKKLGEETFLDIFNIKVIVKAKKDLDRKQFDLPDSVRGQLKQAKAGVKLIKE